jgi:hypothetical protein
MSDQLSQDFGGFEGLTEFGTYSDPYFYMGDTTVIDPISSIDESVANATAQIGDLSGYDLTADLEEYVQAEQDKLFDQAVADLGGMGIETLVAIIDAASRIYGDGNDYAISRVIDLAASAGLTMDDISQATGVGIEEVDEIVTDVMGQSGYEIFGGTAPTSSTTTDTEDQEGGDATLCDDPNAQYDPYLDYCVCKTGYEEINGECKSTDFDININTGGGSLGGGTADVDTGGSAGQVDSGGSAGNGGTGDTGDGGTGDVEDVGPGDTGDGGTGDVEDVGPGGTGDGGTGDGGTGGTGDGGTGGTGDPGGGGGTDFEPPPEDITQPPPEDMTCPIGTILVNGVCVPITLGGFDFGDEDQEDPGELPEELPETPVTTPVAPPVGGIPGAPSFVTRDDVLVEFDRPDYDPYSILPAPATQPYLADRRASDIASSLDVLGFRPAQGLDQSPETMNRVERYAQQFGVGPQDFSQEVITPFEDKFGIDIPNISTNYPIRPEPEPVESYNPLSLFARGGVAESPNGIGSLMERRAGAVNRMLLNRAGGNFV